MGCDIHIRLEVRKNGKWEPLVRMVPNRWHDPERYAKKVADGATIYDFEKPEVLDTLWDGRNYDLFAMFADVRNGRGFAGVDTGDGFLPIAFPRGIPDDAHPDTKEFLNSYDIDGHSHSWHTLAHFEAYNWDMTTKKRGTVSAVEYAAFKRDGKPTTWCGAINGPAIQHVSAEEMESLYQEYKEILDKTAEELKDASPAVLIRRDFNIPEDLKNVFTIIQWDETYRDSAGNFITESLPRMRQLAEEEGVGPDDIRMLFFFDN
jgi:hypothetical protein